MAELLSHRPPPTRSRPGALTSITPANVGLLAGAAYAPGASYTIPVNNPTTATDQQAGQVVTSKTFPLLAFVSVPAKKLKVYGEASVCVRDQALFGYALFYNTVSFEMAPGANMVVNGAIRANGATSANGTYVPGSGDLYMGGSSGTVNVLGKITAAGTINYGRNAASGQPTLAPASAGQWYVPYSPASGSTVYTNTPGITYNASGMNPANSNYNASQTSPFLYSPSNADLISMMITTSAGTSGFLSDGNPSGIPGVITANWTSLAQTVTNNNVQDGAGTIPIAGVSTQTPLAINQINQPPVPSSNSNYSAAAEAAKYSNQAGLYLVAETNGTVSAFPSATAATAYLASGTAGSTARSNWKTNNPSSYLILPGSPAVAATKTTAAVPAVPYVVTSQNVATGSTTPNNPISPFLDGRQNQTVTPIDIDLGNLRNVVAGASGAGAITYANGTAYTLDGPAPCRCGGRPRLERYSLRASRRSSNHNQFLRGCDQRQSRHSRGHYSEWRSDKQHDGRPYRRRPICSDRSQTDSAGIQGFTLATNAPLYTLRERQRRRQSEHRVEYAAGFRQRDQPGKGDDGEPGLRRHQHTLLK